MFPHFSKKGSGGQRLPQGSPSSQIERDKLSKFPKIQIETKSIQNISKNPGRNENNRNQLRIFPQVQITKESIKNLSTNPNRKEVNPQQTVCA